MLFFPTTDEDVAYFRSQGYTGSLNDMHYKALGDLGYTGSLNDRIHAYLVSEYGSFYEAMRDLRNGTSVFSLRSYTINGFDPALVFDFKGNYFRKVATDSTFAASITHTRASSATMVNSSGTLVTVGNNVPRTGHHIYNGSAWVNEGILHESEARTNLVDISNSFNVWNRIGTSVTASTETSPSGSADAFIVKPTVSSGTTWVFYLPIINTGVVSTISTFAKASGKPFLTMSNSGGQVRYASFNLTTGAVGTVASGYTANMEDFGNGWYRCSVTTPTGFNERAVFAVSDTDDGISSAVNGDDGILLYGAQLEAGSTPSSYIPTSGASATRAADLLTVPAANLPYDSTNMSIQMNGKMTYSDDQLQYQAVPYQWLSNAVNFIRPTLNTQSGRTGQLILFQRQGTSGQDAVSSSLVAYAAGVNVPFNFAARHGSTFINGAHEGTLLTANTTPTALPDLSAADLNLGGQFMGTIGQFRMWNEDLTDAGIVEAST